MIGESRQRREDTALRKAYRAVYNAGTVGRYLRGEDARKVLLLAEILTERKSTNNAGLQIADLLANPLTRDTLVVNDRLDEVPGKYGKSVVDTVTPKYNKREGTGRIAGYGRVLLT